MTKAQAQVQIRKLEIEMRQRELHILESVKAETEKESNQLLSQKAFAAGRIRVLSY